MFGTAPAYSLFFFNQSITTMMDDEQIDRAVWEQQKMRALKLLTEIRFPSHFCISIMPNRNNHALNVTVLNGCTAWGLGVADKIVTMSLEDKPNTNG